MLSSLLLSVAMSTTPAITNDFSVEKTSSDPRRIRINEQKFNTVKTSSDPRRIRINEQKLNIIKTTTDPRKIRI
jgi:hypothetical protein